VEADEASVLTQGTDRFSQAHNLATLARDADASPLPQVRIRAVYCLRRWLTKTWLTEHQLAAWLFGPGELAPSRGQLCGTQFYLQQWMSSHNKGFGSNGIFDQR